MDGMGRRWGGGCGGGKVKGEGKEGEGREKGRGGVREEGKVSSTLMLLGAVWCTRNYEQ